MVLMRRKRVLCVLQIETVLQRMEGVSETQPVSADDYLVGEDPSA